MSKTRKPFVDFRAIRGRITMEQVLERYGVLHTLKRSGSRLSGPCPIHGGSNPTQFRVETDKNIWNCFSECKHGGNTLDFIARVREELKIFFGQTRRIAEHLKNADHNLIEKSALLETHHREIQKVRDEMTRTHRLYIQEQITAQGFGDFYKPAEHRLNQLLAELPKLEAEVDFLKVNKLSADDVLHESNSLHNRWPKLPQADKRKIIEALIEKIVIGNGEIDITFSHLPSSEEQCKTQQRLGPG